MIFHVNDPIMKNIYQGYGSGKNNGVEFLVHSTT